MRSIDLWVEDPACLFHDRHSCALDPISLTGLALGGLAGGAASLLGGGGGGGAAPAPAAPPSAPAPARSPQGTKSTNKPQQPTFIGSAATPQTSGQKSLLGQ